MRRRLLWAKKTLGFACFANNVCIFLKNAHIMCCAGRDRMDVICCAADGATFQLIQWIIPHLLALLFLLIGFLSASVSPQKRAFFFFKQSIMLQF